ncbi:MAG TPA: hypothetical protein VGR12_00950 [Solirubrobacteraceae bacterium]|nr:hypothetical protein [Solirubrobacteraceae bacterium]
MNGHQLAVVRGWADTRTTLRAWNGAPFAVLGRWAGLSLAICIALLAAVLLIASLLAPYVPPTATRLLPGVTTEAEWADVATVLQRNSLVLALHALACLAGFIAKSSLPIEAASYSGRWRKLHDVAGPAAIVFVTGAILFSLGAQSLQLGAGLATLSVQLDTPAASLLAVLCIHALPELVALFLPLAAWLVAARAGAWHQLMAATIVTTAIALPVLAVAALVEVFVTPRFV